MGKKVRYRNKEIFIRVSPEEYDTIKEKAQLSNKNLSEYLREIAVTGVIINYEPFKIKEVCAEINRVGNNINQVTKMAHERGGVIDEDVEELRSQYENLFNIVLEKVMGAK